MSCVRLLFFGLLAWVITSNAWAQIRQPWDDSVWSSRQIMKISNGAFDDKEVSFWRAVIVESGKPLFKHGEQMSEQDLLNHLSRWARDDSTVVALDSGFMLPVLPGLYKVSMRESCDTKMAPDKKSTEDVGIGTAIRIKAEDHPSGLHMEAQIELYGMKGLSLRESFVNRLKWGPVTMDVTKQASIGLIWDTPLATVTALTGSLEGAKYPYCTVFLLPVSRRPALKAAMTDAPAAISYSRASVQVVSGVVRSTTFWAMMKDIRPDICRPEEPVSGDLLDLFWSDEKWQIFKAAMEKQGTVWAAPVQKTLTPENPEVSAEGEGIKAAFHWRPDNRMYWLVDILATSMAEGVSRRHLNQTGVRLWSESHHRRWNFIVRKQGMTTYLMAVRFEFQ